MEKIILKEAPEWSRQQQMYNAVKTWQIQV